VRGTILDVLSQRGKTNRRAAGRRLDRLYRQRSMYPIDPARRHRRDQLDRRPHHDPEDQQLAVDVRRDLRCGGRPLLVTDYADATPPVSDDPTGMLVRAMIEWRSIDQPPENPRKRRSAI